MKTDQSVSQWRVDRFIERNTTLPDDLRDLDGERLFTRLPATTSPRDVVTLSDGRQAVVETAHRADDLRDAKCVVIVL